MPKAGMLWRHVICNAKNTWLHGDTRGFRDRDHRIDSSGDYKNPPPEGEHEGLREWAERRSGDPVDFEQDLRPLIVRAFVDRLRKEQFVVLCASCSKEHVHALTELPSGRAEVNAIVGRCKRQACDAMAHVLRGEIWAAGGEYKIVKDEEHQRNVYGYITGRQGPGTFVWTFKGEEYWMPRK